MVTITYLYDQQPHAKHPTDVDNLPKPILDALKGLIYSDDSQVTDLICRKRRHGVVLNIPDSSPLLRFYYNSSVEFVHVNVENAPSAEVSQ